MWSNPLTILLFPTSVHGSSRAWASRKSAIAALFLLWRFLRSRFLSSLLASVLLYHWTVKSRFRQVACRADRIETTKVGL